MSTIADFHDLVKPTKVSCDTTDWYVTVTGMKSYYLLNHTCHLGNLVDHSTTEFYFSTEVRAHVQANEYYKQHNAVYPWRDEWRDAIANADGGTTNDSSVESQVMEF